MNVQAAKAVNTFCETVELYGMVFDVWYVIDADGFEDQCVSYSHGAEGEVDIAFLENEFYEEAVNAAKAAVLN